MAKTEHLTDNPEYELFFDWGESEPFVMEITKVIETNGEPGATVSIGLNKKEAKALFDYLHGYVLHCSKP